MKRARAISATPIRLILLVAVLLLGGLVLYGFIWFPSTVQTDRGDHGGGGGVVGTHPDDEHIPNQ
jgi:hypothetical protein